MKTRFVHGSTQWNNMYVGLDGEITVDLEKKALRIHDGVTPGGFEAVGTKAYDPPVGPGPEEIIAGTREAGYYGIVESADFITGTQLASEIGLSAGTAINSTRPWLKFSHHGKVLFVASRPIRYSVTWDDIYRVGAVYGTDDFGYAKTANGQEVLQDCKVTIGNDTYRVRLLTGGNKNPATTGGGEWDDLMYNVHINGSNTDGWASFDDAYLSTTIGNGSQCWMQESRASNLQNRIARGGSSIGSWHSGPSDGISSSRGWRPVLELIPPET